jgi:phosphatidate cytidylyltransferase
MSLFLGAEMVLLCALSWWLGLLEQRLMGVWLAASAAWVLAVRCCCGGATRLAADPARRAPGRRIAGTVGGLDGRRAGAHLGINFLLSLLVLVWVADVFAYFAGRRFGLRFTRNKLAPSISPGKSWEGVWGGMVGVLVLALAWVWADASAQATVAQPVTRGWPRAAGGCC